MNQLARQRQHHHTPTTTAEYHPEKKKKKPHIRYVINAFATTSPSPYLSHSLTSTSLIIVTQPWLCSSTPQSEDPTSCHPKITQRQLWPLRTELPRALPFQPRSITHMLASQKNTGLGEHPPFYAASPLRDLHRPVPKNPKMH